MSQAPTLTQRWLFAIATAKATGLSPKVIYAWTLAENTDQSVNRRPYNWLNLTTTSTSTNGWSGVPIANKDHGQGSLLFPGFKSLADGIKETSWWINHMGNYQPIRDSRGKSDQSQLQAISSTPWNPGGYNNLAAIYRNVPDPPKIDFKSLTKILGSKGSIWDGITSGAGKVVNAPANAAEGVAKAVGDGISSGFKYIAMKAVDSLAIIGGLLLFLLGLALIGADIGLETRAARATATRLPSKIQTSRVNPAERGRRREAATYSELEAEHKRNLKINREARGAEKLKQEQARTSKARAEAKRARARNKPRGGEIPY